MARKPRIHYPGAFYHVILRGNDGQDIFYTKTDRSRFYQLLQEGVERYGHRITMKGVKSLVDLIIPMY